MRLQLFPAAAPPNGELLARAGLPSSLPGNAARALRFVKVYRQYQAEQSELPVNAIP